MEEYFKSEERELVKLVQYFKKRAQTLLAENKLGEDFLQMIEACDKFVEQLNFHAKNREAVLNAREQLKGLIRDNAKCPTCHGAEKLKVIGFDTNVQGWKSNKYKCRKCNIAFVWNAPNNPWDMIPYVEKFISDTEIKLGGTSDPETKNTLAALEQMKNTVATLKPVVESSDKDLKEMEERELQMADMVHKFKKQLAIEKIRMED
jgi:hypothetical protein